MKGPQDLARRCAGLARDALAASLDARGYATTGPLLEAAECAALVDLYGEETRFRSRVDMARFRFGEGEYKYFAAPLPEPVAILREALYALLAPVGNRWAESAFPRTSPAWRVCAPATARPGPRRCCSATARAATTACIKTSTERPRSRSSSRCC